MARPPPLSSPSGMADIATAASDPLASVLAFAESHCLQLESLSAAPKPDEEEREDLPASQMRHDVRVKPLFDASGQAARLSQDQHKVRAAFPWVAPRGSNGSI